MICEYGCGQEAKYQFKNGKLCCENYYSKCPEVIKKQNESRQLKLKENLNNELCYFGCGNVAKYKGNNEKWCCDSHHTKCPTYREFQKNNNQMYNTSIKEKHKKAMEKLTGKNNPLYTCDGALDKHLKSQRSKETRMKKSESAKNSVKKGIHPSNQPDVIELIKNKLTGRRLSPERIVKMSYTIDYIKQKYPLFSKIEEIRYNPDKPELNEIQVHCKNHNCQNSKEKGGWFTPDKKSLLYERIRSIEHPKGSGAGYFYCSYKCKEECPLYNKTVTQIIKEDQIKAGLIKEDWYDSTEYQIFREEVLRRSGNKCEYCGEVADHVHHSRPQKLEPFFSLDPDYGISCCKKCHYEKGHKDECSTGQLASIICK